MELTEPQKAYLAGFFDGEGCIMVYRFKRSPSYYLRHKKSEPGRYYYAIRIQIAQKDVAFLKELQAEFGGWFGGQLRGRYGQWQLYNRTDVTRFLELITPHLRIKKQQAELALELVRTVRTTQNWGKKLSPEERDRRDQIVDEIKALKKGTPFDGQSVPARRLA